MDYIDDLVSKENFPKLIPSFKKVERRLLSVFMALLELSEETRSEFLLQCGYRSGRTAKYSSFMEVEYKGSKYADVRPDGLVACQRGKSSWGAFIEAKAEKSEIRADQIQDYATLAKQVGVNCIITISNEFARRPDELPYHLSEKARKGIDVFHFAWADIRTMLELIHTNSELSSVESRLLHQCLNFFWQEGTGILTYDAMPQSWPDFVEAASTALGFNQNAKGLTEIVHGWQQERRDLCSKLAHETNGQVELRHKAGVRSSNQDRFKVDKSDLASDYTLNALYHFSNAVAALETSVDLRACRTNVILEISPPKDKGPKAIVSWLSRELSETSQDLTLAFLWPRKTENSVMTLREFLSEPAVVSEGRKDSPKAIRLVLSEHGVRRFKSRKLFIEDLEAATFSMLALGQSKGWLPTAT